MARASRNGSAGAKGRAAAAKKAAPRGAKAAKAQPAVRSSSETAQQAGWATDLVFDVREPKLAVSLRLDADVLRFFRGFGAGYQTRINEVLKAFMHARGGPEAGRAAVAAKSKAASSAGAAKRAR